MPHSLGYNKGITSSRRGQDVTKMPQNLCIAIDGPVAVGKTTVGRLLARRLGVCFVDTGNMYRALTWLALEKGLDLHDQEALTKLAQEADIDLTQRNTDDSNPEPVYVEGQEVTGYIRSPNVERGVSLVARIGGVRTVLVAKQQELSRKGSIILAGRDIGTVVMPHATLKIFLVASAAERARRRHRELEQMGRKVDYHIILAELRRRDKIDSERDVSPLMPAPDALIVDTDGRTMEQVLTEIEDRLRALQ